MIKKFRTHGYHPLRKLKVIFTGLQVAVLSDFSFAYKLILSIPLLVVSCVFQKWLDVHLILLATGMVLVAELFNSAIEILCDFVENREDNRIRDIKDIAAAAAGISIFVWATILIIESGHLWWLIKG